MGKSKTVFICQFHENSILLIKCLFNNNRREFVGIETENLPPNSDDKTVSEKLQELLKKLEYHGGNPVQVCLPRKRATCRYLKIPSQTPSEIEKIISLQASRYLPYSSNELITGYQVLSMDKEGFSDINLIILPKEVIDRYIKIFGLLNISGFKIFLSSYGITNLYYFLKPQDSESVMIVDVDSKEAEITVTAGQKLIFSRFFRFNSLDPNWKKSFAQEIYRTEEAFRKETSRENPSKMVFLGAGKFTQELSVYLKEEESKSAEVLPFDTKAKMTDSFLNAVIGSEISLTGMVGMALKENQDSLNLMPPEFKNQLNVIALHKEHVKLILYVFFITVVSGLGINKDLDNKAEYLQKIRLEASKITKDARRLEEIEKRLFLLDKRSRKKPMSLELIFELYQKMPMGMYLNNLTFEDEKQVILNGQSTEFNSVSTFATLLQDSALFKNYSIKIRYASKKKTVSGEMVNFEIACVKNR